MLNKIPTQDLIQELKNRGLDCFDPRLKFTNKVKYEYETKAQNKTHVGKQGMAGAKVQNA